MYVHSLLLFKNSKRFGAKGENHLYSSGTSQTT